MIKRGRSSVLIDLIRSISYPSYRFACKRIFIIALHKPSKWRQKFCETDLRVIYFITCETH